MRVLILAPCVLPLLFARANAQCLGDFNGDGKVTMNELITAVDNALYGCEASPSRFRDNGDGTVTDRQSGLIWEKKTGTTHPGMASGYIVCGFTGCGDPHDVNNVYDWSGGSRPDGTVFGNFLARLNTGVTPDGVAPIVGCFAGHCDWRLPSLNELQGIIDLTRGACGGGTGACIDPAFGPTQDWYYWTATGDGDSLGFTVWQVWDGGFAGFKGEPVYARAVRGGF
jgi:hypothetical protein